MTKAIQQFASLSFLILGLILASNSAHAFNPWQVSITNQTQDGCTTCLTLTLSSLNNYNLSSVTWLLEDGTTTTSTGPWIVGSNSFVMQECFEFQEDGNQIIELTVVGIDPANNQPFTDVIDIVVDITYECELEADFAYCIDDCEVCFENLTTSNSCITPLYLWAFGDGTFSNEENPCHTYTSSGEMDVVLTVFDDQEMCVDTEEQTVFINEVCEPPCECTVMIHDVSWLYVNNTECNYLFSVDATTSGECGFPPNATQTYTWDFGDGQGPQTQINNNNLFYSLPGIGTYTVTVTYAIQNNINTECLSTDTYVEEVVIHCDDEFNSAFGKSNNDDDNATASEVSLFPNPGTDVITVTYNSEKSAKASLTIIDNAGATIAVHSITPNTNNTIDVTNLQAGSYYVIIEDDVLIFTTTQKFIKTN